MISRMLNQWSLFCLQMAQLAKACTQENPQLRPSMRSIVVALMTLSSTTDDWDVGSFYENQNLVNLMSGRQDYTKAYILYIYHVWSQFLISQQLLNQMMFIKWIQQIGICTFYQSVFIRKSGLINNFIIIYHQCTHCISH